MSRKGTRIGLFGGSFDPVHKAHVAVAREAVRQACLERMIFLPAAQSPLKVRGPEVSGAFRMEMLRVALAKETWAQVDGWELQQEGPSYSWQTVEHFRRQLGSEAELYWLLGADQWVQLEKWKRWEYLAAEVIFLVFSRDGQQPSAKSGVKAVFLAGTFEGSSTQVRRDRAMNNPAWVANLHPGVAQLIEDQRLYQ